MTARDHIEQASGRSALAWLEEQSTGGRKPPRFTSIGSYTLVAYAADGGPLHPDCVDLEQCRAQTDRPTGHRDQWRILAIDTYDEGPPMACSHCNEPIESSYGEPDTHV